VTLTFSALDGMVDESAFSAAVINLLGRNDDDTAINFSSFLVLRSIYSDSVGTLVGGFRLSGRQYIRSVITQLSKSEPCPKALLVDELSELFLDAKLMTLNVSLRSLLQTAKFSLNYSDITGLLLGSLSFGGLFASSVPLNYQQKYDIVQMLVDKSGLKTYALCRDGNCCIFDNVTGRVISCQRLLYAEPLLSRSVEGYEKHLRWLLDCGLPRPDDQGTAVSIDRYEEMNFLSKVLSDYSISLGITNILSLDSESGLIVVNSSLVSSSICVHEPTTLRRLYRIKAPGDFTPELEKALRDISSSPSFTRPQLAPTGCVRDIKISSSKSLIICSVYGSKTINIINMLTGDIISELSGHMGTITTIGKTLLMII
jgi:hypothetical protein